MVRSGRDLFLAGHETSARLFAWAMYLVATHPDWQDRLAARRRVIEPV